MTNCALFRASLKYVPSDAAQDTPMPTSLYIRLSGFYWFYFAALGVLLPYWGIYLQGLGFAPARIGELLGIVQVTRLIAPNLWGWLGDRSGQRMRIIRWASLASAVSFSGVYAAAGSYLWLALATVLFSFFWHASLPQFEVVTLGHLGTQVHRYSRVRLWGSLGFIAAVVGMGPLLNIWGTASIPHALLLLFVLLWLNSLLVSDAPSTVRATLPTPPISHVLRQPAVLALFAACFLHQVAHAIYYGFFSLYLGTLSYTQTTIGLLWGLGVSAEVGIFIIMPSLLARFQARRLLLLALALAVLRWQIIGHVADYLPALLLAQMLHAFTFGAFHAASIELIQHFFPGALQGRGQALYSSLSFGAGSAVGSLIAGYLWQGWGPSMMFNLAALLAALAWLIAWRKLRI